MAEALALQKMRMMMGFHASSEQQWHHDADRTTSPPELDDAGKSRSRRRLLRPTRIMTSRATPSPCAEQEPVKDRGRRSRTSSRRRSPWPLPLPLVQPRSVSTPCSSVAHCWRTVSDASAFIGSHNFLFFYLWVYSPINKKIHCSVIVFTQGCQNFLLWSCPTPSCLLAYPPPALPWP